MRALVLSPHFDDAPLSLGQAMLDGELAGHRVTVGVVFGRTNWQRWFHPTRRRAPLVRAIRRAEEAVAARRFSYKVRTARFEEVILRTGSGDTAGYLDAALPLEPVLVGEVAAAIASWVADADRVYAPLGLGGHVDHRLEREAARAAVPAERLALYEDRPYACYMSDGEIAAAAGEVDGHLEARDASGPIGRGKVGRLWYPSQFDSYFTEAMRKDTGAARHERVWAPVAAGSG
jgi:LmbE family N-acetylglucosaminyl deacetylase